MSVGPARLAFRAPIDEIDTGEDQQASQDLPGVEVFTEQGHAEERRENGLAKEADGHHGGPQNAPGRS